MCIPSTPPDAIATLEAAFDAELHPHIPRHSLQAREQLALYKIHHFREKFA